MNFVISFFADFLIIYSNLYTCLGIGNANWEFYSIRFACGKIYRHFLDNDFCEWDHITVRSVNIGNGVPD